MLNRFADLWEMILLRKDMIDVDLVALMMWLIWNRRNCARLGEFVLEYHQVRAKAECLLLEYKSAQG